MNEAIAGTWKPTSVWGGYKDGMIKLAPLNPAVPADVRAKVTKLEADLKAGSFHPFTGPVVDQDGKERLASGQKMSDDDLGKMDYYVQGVASRLPRK
jgi:simple sugar transport system substrate-binding protein